MLSYIYIEFVYRFFCLFVIKVSVEFYLKKLLINILCDKLKY